MHISDDFVESIFVAIYGVFETRRERAAATLFLSVLLERNTLPLTGAWGGWVVGGLGGGWLAGGWLAGCWVWIIGFDIYILLLMRVHGVVYTLLVQGFPCETLNFDTRYSPASPAIPQ